MSDENRKLPAGAATANCKRCQETPVPSNFGSPRKCAFDSSGKFTSDNWNCVTAGELRALAGEGWEDKKDPESFFVRRDDQSYAAIWIPPHPEDVPDGERAGPFRGGGFIAMTWYKHRGQTEIIIRVDPRDGGMPDEAGLPLTAHEAEAALKNLKLAGRELKGIVPKRSPRGGPLRRFAKMQRESIDLLRRLVERLINNG